MGHGLMLWVVSLVGVVVYAAALAHLIRARRRMTELERELAEQRALSFGPAWQRQRGRSGR